LNTCVNGIGASDG